jgi:hypothetical protein
VELVSLDCGRSSTQLMRDSLGTPPVHLNNDISGYLGTGLLCIGWGALVAWYHVRFKEWKRARLVDDATEESRKHVEVLKSRANRAALWTIGGMVAVWILLDLLF